MRLPGGAGFARLPPMTRKPAPHGSDDRPTVPVWGVVGGATLLGLTAIAAPFYADVMAGLLWAGEALRALCGW